MSDCAPSCRGGGCEERRVVVVSEEALLSLAVLLLLGVTAFVGVAIAVMVSRGFFGKGGRKGQPPRKTTKANDDDPNRVDVIIVGCGISGVAAAVYLKRNHPDKTYEPSVP